MCFAVMIGCPRLRANSPIYRTLISLFPILFTATATANANKCRQMTNEVFGNESGCDKMSGDRYDDTNVLPVTAGMRTMQRVQRRLIRLSNRQ